MREDPHDGECEQRGSAVMLNNERSSEGVNRGMPLDLANYHGEEGDCGEEQGHPGRTFLYMERTDEPPGACTKLILNFKKLKLRSEQDFAQMVRQNCATILDTLKKAEVGIAAAAINNIGIPSLKDKNGQSVKCNNEGEAKNRIVWELDLSYNYFVHLSIGNVLYVLMQNRIISQGGVLKVRNLATINIRKNLLTLFPHWGEYKLESLLHLCLSHNEICEVASTGGSPTNGLRPPAEMETRPACAPNVERDPLFVAETKGERPGEEGALNWQAPNLTHLYLQNNKITSLQFVKYLLNGHKNVSHINISFNRIKSLNDFPFLANLKQFDLSFNTQLSCLLGDKQVERKRGDSLLSAYEHEGAGEQNGHARSNFFNIPSRGDKQLNHQNIFAALKYFFPNLESLNLKHTPLLSRLAG
ncbi:leucine-rich repeat protein [Plasmodium vivax]|uniref:Leucine-rich repeat protein n=3 Tax=Plasmodium vivax TaxID=5855 RepID=A0A0J9WEE5_PLAVI|nr:hypothetical protein PVIIG_02760 [Plasmodium vivax India VII]KNA00519.1 hypothetical protein PVNG_04676 [Plasmodium vivax North Korean]CAG9480341.1 unnamed protein product [Plasmodium vivax]CAI7719507.1 leucine-rich repeat protein [Plasmodium vivax]SCO66388.1 leucine-rich repeat protein [Plasmodium vivax]